MKVRKRYLGLIVLLALAIAAGMAPWKDILHNRILSMLAARGITHVDFKITGLHLNGAELSDISVGRDNPLILSKADLKFSLREVLEGTLQDVALSGLTIAAIETDNGWTVTGLDILPKRENAGEPLNIPALFSSLPFRSLTIEDSRFILSGKKMSATVTFTVKMSENLSLDTDAVTFVTGGQAIEIGPLTARMSPDNKESLAGTWSVPSIQFDESLPVPTLSASGTVALKASRIAVKANLADKPQAYKAAVSLEHDFSAKGKNRIVLTSLSFPFKGGRVSTKNVVLAFPMTIPVRIDKASLGDLMGAATGRKVSATGTLSGAVPLTLRADGSYAVGAGTLKADKGGKISMPPSLIPGDNEQVNLVRDILEDLHYTLLSASIVPGKDGRPGIGLKLEGRNPAVYNGREVKLNINLTGDVLDFIRQNLILFQSPEKLLKQEIR